MLSPQLANFILHELARVSLVLDTRLPQAVSDFIVHCHRLSRARLLLPRLIGDSAAAAFHFTETSLTF